MDTEAAAVSIIIADDHPLFRRGLRDVIATDLRFTVVGEASDGIEALDAVERLAPRIIVLDIDMPRMSGLEAAQKIVERELPVLIVILTMYDDDALFRKALDIGVMGYVLKDGAAGEVLLALRAVSEGDYYISPSMTSNVLKRERNVGAAASMRDKIALLSPTELSVLKMIAESKTTDEIAHRLFISRKTVEHHRANMCLKLKISGAYALVRFALLNRSRL